MISYKEAFFEEKDSSLCLIMEFADRGDLYQKIIQNKKKAIFLEEMEIWRIFIQLVKGLKSLHELKILHRDLKSANVFLFSNGLVKLGDLNVSKVVKKVYHILKLEPHIMLLLKFGKINLIIIKVIFGV